MVLCQFELRLKSCRANHQTGHEILSNRVKITLQWLVATRIFYKSKFPALFSVHNRLRKARETLIYKILCSLYTITVNKSFVCMAWQLFSVTRSGRFRPIWPDLDLAWPQTFLPTGQSGQNAKILPFLKNPRFLLKKALFLLKSS